MPPTSPIPYPNAPIATLVLSVPRPRPSPPTVQGRTPPTANTTSSSNQDETEAGVPPPRPPTEKTSSSRTVEPRANIPSRQHCHCAVGITRPPTRRRSSLRRRQSRRAKQPPPTDFKIGFWNVRGISGVGPKFPMRCFGGPSHRCRRPTGTPEDGENGLCDLAARGVLAGEHIHPGRAPAQSERGPSLRHDGPRPHHVRSLLHPPHHISSCEPLGHRQRSFLPPPKPHSGPPPRPLPTTTPTYAGS